MNPTYFALLLTISIALFHRGQRLLISGILITTCLALYQDIVSIEGTVYLGAFSLSTAFYFAPPKDNKLIKTLSFILTASMIFGFLSHKISGFSKILLLNNVTLSKLSCPFSVYTPFDKTMVSLILYYVSTFYQAREVITWRAIKQAIYLLLRCILCVLPITLLTEQIQFDPKFSYASVIWMINNFFCTCFAEEVIFRGFLQQTLLDMMPKSNKFAYITIFIVGLVFGLLGHIRGGMIYALLASICGIFYGYTYYKTRQIICPMIVHVGINLLHALLFTYPNTIGTCK